MRAVFWMCGAGAVACGDSKEPAAIPPPAATPDAGAPVTAPVDAGAPIDPGSKPSIELPPDIVLPPLEVPSGAVCAPGQTLQCTFDLLCTGVQTCAADGQGYGPCECQLSNLVGPGIVGAACESDADCQGGATCMRGDSNDFTGQGGPAGGYCTFACAGSEDCTSRDPQSECIPLGPDGSLFCARTCLSKQPDVGEGKCLNRTNVVCLSEVAGNAVPLAAERQSGLCIPFCGSDEECPEGRHCHRQGGFCTDFVAPGAPVGSACAIDADCEGSACEDRDNGVGTCTAQCVLGSLSGCGYGRDAEVRDAACVVPVVAAGRFSEGPGDLGLCLELCDEAADCQQASAGFACRPLNPDLAAFLGRPGACGRE
jgi:hypothetical protein